MDKKWKVAEGIEEELKNKFPEINSVVLQLLVNRDLTTQEKIDEFLYPDYSRDQNSPDKFKDLDKALERIDQALKNKEKVVVHGDYDADGVSSTCLMKEVLEAIGIKDLEIYIPHRETEGYGLNPDTIKRFVEDKVDLVVTVDCGIANHEEIKQAKDNGIDIIVTDHHHEPLDIPDKAVAILDSAIESETYPFKSLSGAGVAFKLAQALVKKYDLGEGFEKWLLDLVAISTVADCMPLLGENRTLVKYGLIVLNKTKRVGVKKLLASCGNNFSEVDAQIIGFRLGPRLNAAGRLDHANTAYQLLATNDEAEADDLVKQLNESNAKRQKITGQMIKQSENQIEQHKDKPAIFAFNEDWSIGVLGLVAGKVADEKNKPTFVVTENNGEISGSGRSIKELNIIETIQECEEFLARFGGHAQACGFTLKPDADYEAFKEKFSGLVEKKLKGKDLRKELNIEAELELKDLNWELMNELEKFKPFGEANHKPKFLLKNVAVSDWQLVGKNNDHLRMVVAKDSIVKQCIGFGFGKIANDLQRGLPIDMVFELDINEWNGSRELQIQIIDIKYEKK